MVAISSSSSAVRSSVQQTNVLQVRRTAELAQQAANALQAQARDAWQKVDSAEANARAVDAQANQAISTAAQAKQSLVSFGAGIYAAGTATKAVTSDTNTYAKAAPTASSTSTAQAAPAVFNALGQRLGSVINITA